MKELKKINNHINYLENLKVDYIKENDINALKNCNHLLEYYKKEKKALEESESQKSFREIEKSISIGNIVSAILVILLIVAWDVILCK